MCSLLAANVVACDPARQSGEFEQRPVLPSVTPLEAAVESFETSEAFAPIPGSALELDALPAERSELIILTGLMRSDSTEEGAVGIRFEIDGVERGEAQSSSLLALNGGPLMLFDLRQGPLPPQTLDTVLTRRSGTRAIVENLRIVAWPMPTAAILGFAEAVAPQQVPPDSTQRTLSLEVDLRGGTGPFVALASACPNEAPSTSNVLLRWVDDQNQPYLSKEIQNIRDYFQCSTLAWELSATGPTATVVQEVVATALDVPATVATSRLVIFDLEQVPAVFRRQRDRVNTTAVRVLQSESVVSGIIPAWLVFQGALGRSAPRSIQFQVAGETIGSFNHTPSANVIDATYGAVSGWSGVALDRQAVQNLLVPSPDSGSSGASDSFIFILGIDPQF